MAHRFQDTCFLPYFSCADIPEISQMDVTVADVVLGDWQFRIPEVS